MNEKEMMKGFMLLTHVDNCQETLHTSGELAPPVEKQCRANAKFIPLPDPDILDDKEMSFLELIELRATIRKYSETPITAKELSFMLWCTQGVKMMTPDGRTMRNVPSAGGRHPFETYLCLRNVQGITPGIYRFLALGHALEVITTEEEEINQFLSAFKSQAVVENAAAVFLWVAEYERTSYRFGNRAARYVFLDAGHVCQNLYLSAYTQQIATCALGSFYEEKLQELLLLNKEDEYPVYGAAVGKVNK